MQSNASKHARRLRTWGHGSPHHLTPKRKMRRDVSLPASRLLAKECGKGVRHDAGSLRPPPAFARRKRSFRKRSDFRPHDRLSPIHGGRHARAPGPGRQQRRSRCSLWVNCGKPRLGRSTQGVCNRLPGGAVVLSQPPRRRCAHSRQFRDTVDIVPPLSGNVGSAFIPLLGWCQEGSCAVSLLKSCVAGAILWNAHKGPRYHQTDRRGWLEMGGNTRQPPSVQASGQAGPGHCGRETAR